MPSSTRMGGLVLAGGRSRRFGSEKAGALLQGRPLLIWALDHLAVLADPLAVSAAPGSQAEALARSIGCTVVHDHPNDAQGPLAGIASGLRWAHTNALAFLAVEPCDTPSLPPDLHVRLREVLGEAPAAFAETREGPHPLCALWRVSALAEVEAALSSGEHPPVGRLLREIGAVPTLFEQNAAFANANRREDLHALRDAQSAMVAGSRGP